MQKFGKILFFWFVFQQITKSNKGNETSTTVKSDDGLENETGDSNLIQVDQQNQLIKDSLIAINNIFKDKLPKNNFSSLQQFQQPLFVKKLFRVTQLRQFQEPEKQKAGTHILIFFTIKNLNQFDQLKKYLYAQECKAKKFGDIKKLSAQRNKRNISDITYYQYKRGLKITQQWLDYKNTLFQYLQKNPHIENYDDIQKLINWNNYKEFMDEFNEYMTYIIEEAKWVNCGMANFLNFYNLVYRFVYTVKDEKYKNNLSLDQTFQQLYEESQVFYVQIYDSYLHRLYFMHFWAVLMEQLNFLISTGEDRQRYFIQRLIDILLYFDQPIKYSANKMEKVDAYCISNYESLKNILTRVEQSLKAKDKKLRKEYATLEQIEQTQSGSFSSIYKVLIVLMVILLN